MLRTGMANPTWHRQSVSLPLADQSGLIPARSTNFRQGVPSPPRRRPSSHASHSHSSHLPVSSETSAGGIAVDVIDGIPCAALIARHSRIGRIEWCLSKGHLEAGETPKQAALREVTEETGIHGRTIRHLTSIDYWFSGADHHVHKVVHHYLMGYESGLITVEHGPDHEAEKVTWIPLKNNSHRLAYPNERQIVTVALDLLYRGL